MSSEVRKKTTTLRLSVSTVKEISHRLEEKNHSNYLQITQAIQA